MQVRKQNGMFLMARCKLIIGAQSGSKYTEIKNRTKVNTKEY